MEKLEGPTTSLTFLAVVLDTAKSEIRLPETKFLCIHQEVSHWLGKRKATKHQILSLVYLLQHATKVDVRHCSQSKRTRFYTRLGKQF